MTKEIQTVRYIATLTTTGTSARGVTESQLRVVAEVMEGALAQYIKSALTDNIPNAPLTVTFKYLDGSITPLKED